MVKRRVAALQVPHLHPFRYLTFVPACLQTYTDINNGAYRAGFASEQGAHDVAFDKFFAALDRAEAILADSRYLKSWSEGSHRVLSILAALANSCMDDNQQLPRKLSKLQCCDCMTVIHSRWPYRCVHHLQVSMWGPGDGS
jgi:hypothetical protein